MRKPLLALAGASLMLSVSMAAVQAQDIMAPTTPPDPPKFSAQTQPNFVNPTDIYTYQSLPEYHEPDWVTKQFVDDGTLPPVAERLPKEPLVYKASNMPDGIGNYGGVLRHVIGGRPEGWNYSAGQIAGLGRHRYRALGVSDPDRAAVRDQGRCAGTPAEPGQELGVVRGRA